LGHRKRCSTSTTTTSSASSVGRLSSDATLVIPSGAVAATRPDPQDENDYNRERRRRQQRQRRQGIILQPSGGRPWRIVPEVVAACAPAASRSSRSIIFLLLQLLLATSLLTAVLLGNRAPSLPSSSYESSSFVVSMYTHRKLYDNGVAPNQNNNNNNNDNNNMYKNHPLLLQLYQPLFRPVTVIQGDMPLRYLPSKPRVVGVYFEQTLILPTPPNPTPLLDGTKYSDNSSSSSSAEAAEKKQKMVQPLSKQLPQRFFFTTFSKVVNVESLDPNHHYETRIRSSHTSNATTNTTTTSTSSTDTSPDAMERARHIVDDSNDYEDAKPDVFETDECIRQYDWQVLSYPTCNLLLEQDLTNFKDFQKQQQQQQGGERRGRGKSSGTTTSTTMLKMIASGYWRDVWVLPTTTTTTITAMATNEDDHPKSLSSVTSSDSVEEEEEEDETIVLKTIRYQHDYTERNMERHRRDAIAMERLTSSPYVMDIYAYCGNSGLFEYASGGALQQHIFGEHHHHPDEESPKKWTPHQKLQIAHELAQGLADVHYFANTTVPAMVHADITPNQYVYVTKKKTTTSTISTSSGGGSDRHGSKRRNHEHVTGTYKLNDFNRCRFLSWNQKLKNQTCPFEVGSNSGTVRVKEKGDGV
jgi:hypothetical protein